MNLKKMHKRIFGVVFLSIVAIVANAYHVNAEELCGTNKTKPDSSSIAQRYGFVYEHVGGNKYKLSMTNGCAEGVTFKITSINEKTTNAAVGKDLSCSNPITIELANGDSYPEPNTGLPGLLVKLKSNEMIKDAPKVDNSCYWQYAEAEATTTIAGSDTVETADFSIPATTGTTIVSSVINCDNNTYISGGVTRTIGSGTFEDKFCNAKRKAVAAGNTFDFGAGKYPTDSVKTFKCETDFVSHPELVPSNPDDLKGDDYFVNKSYLYGESKMTESATLIYHYAPSYTNTDTKISCEITCKEAVEVEYGPPVAAVGGVCYEYIVRVTSRVSCNMTKEPDKSKLCKKDYCTPYPHCVHNGGTVYTQGGPSEEFDACVRKCDGGEYSKKCSNSCYKEVYGTSTAYAKVGSTYHDDLFAAKVSMSGSSFSCEGYYNKSSSNGSISWSSSNQSAGRWYCTHTWSPVSAKSTYRTDGNGFFRGSYGACNDVCSWLGCSGDQYLNRYVNGEDVLKADCEANTEIYNDLVASCQKKAMCSTTLSEFTVHVDYTKLGETTVTPLDFPYSGQTDKLQNKGSLVATTQDQKNSTLRYNVPTDAQGMLGCYKNGAPEADLYRATWSFPGSWMNIKTGEISYSPDGKDRTIWYEHPNRFCIPGDAKGVNVLWYNGFMHRTLVEKNILNKTSAKDSYIAGICKYDTVTTSITQYSTAVPADQLKFNITASTRKFGYFEWNIDIKCLYAINEDPLCGTNSGDVCTDTTEVIEECTPNGDEPYRVHTVDLTDVFPNENGDAISDKSKASRSYVGYNWSKYAINDKNEDYVSNPPLYLAKIQEHADSMYTEANLDYEFYLSPKTIRELRKQTVGSNANYTAFSDVGFRLDSNGISRYESSKIRDTSIFDSSNSKVPGKGTVAISCNNMISWNNTGDCDHVHEGV